MRWSILALLTVLSSGATAQPAAVETHAQIERHIDRIERAILPVVTIAGQPQAAVSLTERMKSLHVPGVIGKIEWARGFDVQFQNGLTEWVLALAPDGRLGVAGFLFE